MAGPLPYDYEPRFNEDELRERENREFVDSDSEEEIGPQPNAQPSLGSVTLLYWCICNNIVCSNAEGEGMYLLPWREQLCSVRERRKRLYNW